MNRDELKRRLQAIFADGLVTIVGSGLSWAEGLPGGMGALADQLKADVPRIIGGTDAAAWAEVASLLDSGTGLEAALQKVAVSADLDDSNIQVTADYFVEEEGTVLAECINTERVALCPAAPPFVHLYPQALGCRHDQLRPADRIRGRVGWLGRGCGIRGPTLGTS